ncbi:FKBP-type peptidyl-prolyl cis-trans isomerase [Microbulbifer variabilis]|jgi:FKBP-type peptidyl-prolyl cis-trans isomerase SlyD|uniref:Peptidyl-prolyl cis-trans isomerase n=1 Tax=Microbulbifer variabilis TaxID=266805 RepID=A0ABY4VFF4_9GAMM|nr:peptidylprolyl isomerase [Microbulbifer variabilis]USD23008.1 peptidylprolyl isomerase [Microbulbifer variabilis]
MKIANHTVVEINYTLKDADGTVIDSSANGEPLKYLQGVGNIIPGLEREMLEKAPGDKFTAVISPEEGYGVQNPELIQTMPRSAFSGVEELEVGMAFHAQSTDGHPIEVEIIDIDGDEVTINGNHPLAGVELHFEIEVISVRDATAEEIDHGHVH